MNKIRGFRNYSFTKGLLFIVILLYFTSCGTTNRLGLELQGDDLIEGTFFIDTLEVKTSIVLLDSVNTSNTRFTLVGRYEDEKFGNTFAQGFMQLILPTEDSALTFGPEEAVFDSIVLSLPIAQFFGDTNLQVTYEVHELDQSIDTVNYFQTDKIENVLPEVIGEKVYDSKLDTLGRLIIRLSDEFGRKIFNESGNDVLGSQDQFDELVNGIRIRPKEGSDGHILSLRPYTTSQTSFVRVYYSIGDSSSSKAIGFGRAFHNIENDFSNSTYLSGLSKNNPIPTTETNNEIYVQSGVGIATKIEFPGLSNLMGNNLSLVNRAELFFNPPASEIEEHGTPPTTLIFLLPDDNGSVMDDDSTIPAFLSNENSNALLTLTYNSRGRNFPIPRITTYVQRILDGDIGNNGLILTTPLTIESSDIFGNVNRSLQPAISNPESIRKLIIGAPGYELDKEMKLRVYYTEF